MKYYIYGGAFNPPTIAHQQITEELLKYSETSKSKVMLLPSGERSDKTINLPKETRLEYLEAMLKDIKPKEGSIIIETLELDLKKNSQTFETHLSLMTKYPKDELVWVFGSDSFNSILEWENGEFLLNTLPMIVIERLGFPIDPKLYQNQEVISIKSISETSSTELRERISNGSDFSSIVGDNVLKTLKSS